MPLSILLRCNDVDETRRFYRDALGFSLSDTAEGTLTASGLEGTLIFTESDLWNSMPSFSGTIYFTVPNLDGLYSQVAAKTKIAWGPEVMSYGSREFAVRDCNGYYLAFREPL
jgi:catechol 2,3-dioxygenase-like lactoylglutathione lyase family enzyme